MKLMNILTLTTGLTLSGFVAGTAFAQSAYPEGFTPYGTISLNYLDSGSGGSSETFATADAGFSWNFGGKVGVDFGLYGFAIASSSNSTYYLALAYDLGNARISVGAPSPAYTKFGDFRIERQMPYIGFVGGLLFDSTIRYVDVSNGGSSHSYGLRVDGAAGANFEYAVSVHGFADQEDVYGLSSSARYNFGEGLTVTGGLEILGEGSTTYTKAKLLVAKEFGRASIAAAVASFDMGSGANSFWEVSGAYDLTDKWEVGMGVTGSSGSGFNMVSLDTSYRIWEGASLTAAVSKNTDGGGSDAIYSVGLRYDF